MAEKSSEDIMRRIAALLEKAEATEFGPERDALRAKADDLMRKWQIESWQIDEARAVKGEVRVQKIGSKRIASASEFREMMVSRLGYQIAGSIGLECVLTSSDTKYNEDGRPLYELEAIGYEVDLEYFQMLWTSLVLDIATKMEPRPDPKKSFAENCYMLHEAGTGWERIRQLLNAAHRDGAPWPLVPGADAIPAHLSPTGRFIPGESDGGRMRNAYRAWCAEIGVEPHSVRGAKSYRTTWVDAYVKRVTVRFAEMRHNEGEKGALVLAKRKESVVEAFHAKYPRTTLKYGRAKARTGRVDAKAALEGDRAGRAANLSRPGANSVSADMAKRAGLTTGQKGIEKG